ncbi:MAG: DegT/DnrJ/EryC1/StrS family aminotransferase [Treponema sp.]|nr:DegT/DnrJ/EryC1/StrS family aminotransferase [Treponema sp.]MCL2272847.1 DegT/DnrJ/EryC1/StrS family aminotransferase [Treponema sp.]
MWRVQLHKINYDEREYQAVREVLDSGWLTISEKTHSFESAFSEFLGHDTKSLAVSNCTSALHMALLALGIKEGDEVITPSLTFIADQNVTQMCGAKNVLADITSMEDWSMDPDDIEAKITAKTKAVIIMHYAGFACDMDRVTALCKKRNLFLVEDCAHTPGADYKGRSLGAFGDISAFSFYANKNIAIGEGGMVVTRNAEIYEKLKALRSHGMSVPSFDRYKGRAATYDVAFAGFNYRINEIGSALGFVQLQKLKESNDQRRKLVKRYCQRLDGFSSISIPYRNFSRGKPNYHIMPVLLSENIDRAAVIESMKKDGVQTSIHYPAIQGFTAYKDKVNSTPKAEYVCAHELTLPLYPAMTFDEVDIVCDALVKEIK